MKAGNFQLVLTPLTLLIGRGWLFLGKETQCGSGNQQNTVVLPVIHLLISHIKLINYENKFFVCLFCVLYVFCKLLSSLKESLFQLGLTDKIVNHFTKVCLEAIRTCCKCIL